MGNLFVNLFKKIKVKDCKVLILGLDGAGKSTILYHMKMG
jgi:GTPase SAR1 family protein